MPSAKPLCTSAALSLLLLSARFHEGVSPRHFDDWDISSEYCAGRANLRMSVPASGSGSGRVEGLWGGRGGLAFRLRPRLAHWGLSSLLSSLSQSRSRFGVAVPLRSEFCGMPGGRRCSAALPGAKVRFRNTGGTGIEPVARCAGDLSCQSWASCPTKLLVKTDTNQPKR